MKKDSNVNESNVAERPVSLKTLEGLGVTPLMRAARAGDLSKCGALLDDGAAINAMDAMRWTALMHAAARGHASVVALLLGSGANIAADAFDWATALHAAVAGRHLEVARLLIEAEAPLEGGMQPPPIWSHGIHDYWRPLGLAASNGDGPMFDLLACAGGSLADEHLALFIYRAFAAMGHTPILWKRGETTRFLFSDEEGLSPNIFAGPESFVVPPNLPACLEECFSDDSCTISSRGEDHSGSIARFVPKPKGKKKTYDGAKPEFFDLRRWEELGYSIGLQELLHEGRGDQLGALLSLCAQAGHPQLVEVLLEYGAEPDERAIRGATYYKHQKVVTLLAGKDNDRLAEALCKAAQNHDLATVHSLLEQGADPRAERGPGNALVHATRYDSSAPVIRSLLTAGAPADSTDMSGMPVVALVADRGSSESLRVLLGAGADPNAVTPNDRRSPLHYAVCSNDPDRVSVLLEFGAKPNARDRARRTPLLAAAETYPNVGVEVIDQLLSAGAKLDSRDRRGRTPLLAAIERGTNRELVERLLRAGADVTAVDRKGRTTLILAASGPSGQSQFIEQLVRLGADVNQCYPNGDNLLMRACREDQYFAIEPLIKAGADVNARNLAGETVLGLARANCQKYWIDLLLSRGASE